jgi:hypothetical protein
MCWLASYEGRYRRRGFHLESSLVTYDAGVETAVEDPVLPAGSTATGSPAGRHAVRAAPKGPATLRRLWSAVSVPFWIAATRIVAGLVFAHLVIILLPQARQHLLNNTLNQGTWLGAFDRWDSVYYLGIAQHGYPAHPIGLDAHTAFFPGYPLLVAAAHAVTFGALGYLQSGMVVSWIAFIGASVLLYRLADRLYGQRVALIATALFCWFPASFFFLAPYSEALFAFEIIAVLTLLERDRFTGAALVAAAASATSPESAALTVAVVVAALMTGRGLLRAVGFGALSGLGIVAYVIYLWNQFGHPFIFITVQKADWKRSEHLPFVGLYRNVMALEHYVSGPGSPAPGATEPTFTNIKWVWLLDDGALVLATLVALGLVGLAVHRWRTRQLAGLGWIPMSIPLPMVVVTILIVLLGICTTISPYALPQYASSEGEERFVAVVMPLYLAGALMIRRWASLICLALGGFVILTLVFQAMYNLGYWIT